MHQIYLNPEEEKYQILRGGNEGLRSKLLNAPHGPACLKTIGFDLREEEGVEIYVYAPSDMQRRSLGDIVRFLKERVEQNGDFNASSNSSDEFPNQMRKLVELGFTDSQRNLR